MSYLISASSNLSKNKSLTPTVKFGIGSSFSKDPAFGFSEGPGPGPGPLCKVCHILWTNCQNAWLV